MRLVLKLVVPIANFNHHSLFLRTWQRQPWLKSSHMGWTWLTLTKTWTQQASKLPLRTWNGEPEHNQVLPLYFDTWRVGVSHGEQLWDPGVGCHGIGSALNNAEPRDCVLWHPRIELGSVHVASLTLICQTLSGRVNFIGKFSLSKGAAFLVSELRIFMWKESGGSAC